MGQYDIRVDHYIDKSADFAKPILKYLRELVHETSPLLTETMKWGFPFFDYKGTVCQMSAFKEHCAFGFWKVSLLNDAHHVIKRGDEAAGSIGRIYSMDDLPSKEILTDLILQAIALNEKGVKVQAIKKAPSEKTELIIPDYFIDFLGKDPKVKEAFEKFSYSHKKEYTEWITEAKSEATRQKRMETAAEWIAEGKSRNWKYQR
jgi:uncharacterized protein YdeI (YjbR/CyaY-like superfamily)